MIVIKFLLYLLIILAAILCMVLFIPLRYSSDGFVYETYMIKMDISWLFGSMELAAFKKKGTNWYKYFRILCFKIVLSMNHIAGAKKEKRVSKRNRTRFPDMEFIKRALKTVKELLNYIKPDIFEVKGRFGLEDPCDTAFLWMFISRIRMPEGANINLSPVFDDEVLEGSYKIQGRMMLFTVLLIALKFILSKPVKNILKKERKNESYGN